MKVYFDNAASTKVRKEVVDFLIESYEKNYANPSATHNYGRENRVLLEKARLEVANVINANQQDIIFTSGATESNNLAIKGVLSKTNKKEIITSKIEHSSVLKLMQELEKDYIIHYVKVKNTGEVDIEDIKSKINENTALVSIMAVNNETGVKQDIYSIGQLLKDRDIHFHVDAVQLITKEKIDVKELNIDSLSMSAHKFYGTKGVGMLYIKDSIEIQKQIIGGSQERNKRAGTENFNSILASSLALKIAVDNMQKEQEYIAQLNKYFISKLDDRFSINGENRINNIINIQVKGKNIQLLLAMLDMKGIMVSGGSACMSGSIKASNVLLEMGLSEKQAYSSIRISFSIYNTKEEIDYFFNVMENIL